MPNIIQFLHSGAEAAPIDNIITEIPWNNSANHKRKFIYSPGKYVNSHNIEVEDNLTLWGEWEPQSKIKRLQPRLDEKLPHFLNSPYINPSVQNRTHNTDPYVFGNNFRYIICRQKTLIMLRSLPPLSLILFGSSIRERFCIDTVFVVSDRFRDFTINNIETIFPDRQQYHHASVYPLYGNTKYNPDVDADDSCRIETGQSYRYYEGVKFSERNNFNEIYSFVPCKIYNPNQESDFVFKQPEIELENNIISHGLTQSINSNQDRNYTDQEIFSVWTQIVSQLDEKGFMKGTYFKSPTSEPIEIA